MVQQQQQQRKQVVYFARHAEAAHNILEKQAVQEAIARGESLKEEQERARRSVLNDASLTDACLSPEGIQQAKRRSADLGLLNKMGGSKYAPPKLVLVSPLRRALMTATELFSSHQQEQEEEQEESENNIKPKFVALEALREKRTGFSADERLSVAELEQQFPHVDFSDLKRIGTERPEVPKGEDNAAVRARVKEFLEGVFAKVTEESVAVVTHKGWLRELRQVLKSKVNDGELEVNFDLEKWDQTLYNNSEVRVAEFGWEGETLKSIISKSMENALLSVIEESMKHLFRKTMAIFSTETPTPNESGVDQS